MVHFNFIFSDILLYPVLDNRCRCLVDCFLIMPGACLGLGGLGLKLSRPAQGGGLSKGVKYYILYLVCAGSSGDALTKGGKLRGHLENTI